jgi:hypothetical protein
LPTCFSAVVGISLLPCQTVDHSDVLMWLSLQVNIKSYASNNELAVMPQDRVQKLEWDRRYLSVLGVENKRLYELRLQTPEQVFMEEETDLRRIMDSFRVVQTES